ncbi:T6SS immunity protein Tdi1 domain-containing protein [Agrococcus terreus]|uniref:GAD-related domain-containing protein n=1 Tax=Agrococcus terreus TaxID=574649 RepID=A0ABQ2KCL3_9MICO|nr:GAD-like domain-containing protein [Agrococcus terreus]GGN77336.1 hypothetical protein GCM10010968_01760 [Agrococcus terreus]
MIEISDFQQVAPVPAEVVAAYRERVPAEMVEVWERYGFGTFGEGFVRVIDPREYERGVGDCIGRVVGGTESIPLMVTGLADLIVWEPGAGLTGIIYRNGDTRGLGSKVSTFFNLTRSGGAKHLARVLDWSAFPEAVATHGPLAFDESFTYVPLLSLGGPKSVANLEPRKTIEAIRTMVELQGLIEH